MKLILASVFIIDVISSIRAAVYSQRYIALYGTNTLSVKRNMTILTTKSRVLCGQMCNLLYGCGGFNFGGKRTAGLSQCELKQGTSSMHTVQYKEDVTYYEKTEQDPFIASRDCADLRNFGITASGVYQVNLDSDGDKPELTDVYCDMDTDDGGWLVSRN
ncbi:hypothetical protein LSH36_242g06027 [Paralvinella palmiformis]|uniref:Fibrinogen C-terminal domain-containing protein n=1 Tax=Paralvinella palmiformis TaxID=53620 RepID=A0AAD9N540_9ANNE|nr:hypothetical protein LSH36_242g06027 [Paralvinella palmiformis]